jgi:hypothetical protein
LLDDIKQFRILWYARYMTKICLKIFTHNTKYIYKINTMGKPSTGTKGEKENLQFIVYHPNIQHTHLMYDGFFTKR